MTWKYARSLLTSWRAWWRSRGPWILIMWKRWLNCSIAMACRINTHRMSSKYSPLLVLKWDPSLLECLLVYSSAYSVDNIGSMLVANIFATLWRRRLRSLCQQVESSSTQWQDGWPRSMTGVSTAAFLENIVGSDCFTIECFETHPTHFKSLSESENIIVTLTLPPKWTYIYKMMHKLQQDENLTAGELAMHWSVIGSGLGPHMAKLFSSPALVEVLDQYFEIPAIVEDIDKVLKVAEVWARSGQRSVKARVDVFTRLLLTLSISLAYGYGSSAEL